MTERGPRLYDELAPWFHLLTAPEDYAEEAAPYRRLLTDASDRPIRTVLELGSGGGNNASHLKAHFDLTLVDRSPQMLELSRSLNPDCRHVVGDMRDVRLGETFDAVFAHDAVAYITTEADLAATIATAAEHARPSTNGAPRVTCQEGTVQTASAPPGNTRLLLARDHAAPGTTLPLAKATSLGRGRARPLPWCSRPRSWAASPEEALEFPPVRRYHVTTFGCQMNAHDSERIKGMLEELGLGEAPAQDEADVLVFNTCTIREKPDQRFAAHLAQARALKERHPEKVIAVGGCYAEAQKERLFSLYPYVDVAFGPGSIPHLGEWVGAGGEGVERGAFGIGDERGFAGRLPLHRERRFQAWVQISMGCNSKCTYCIVPSVRGREVSRRPGEVLAEVEGLARDGVREITLLGQNVNSYGRDVGSDFAELLRACDAVDGIDRIRFTSPHPKDFRAPVIAAVADCAAVCEHLHLPLQSGSTRVLKAMRRTYSRERYLRLVDELRAAIPGLALTTDLIVGFPTETEGEFEETLSAVEEVGYDGAFTFVYSPRQGTEAAAMPGQISEELKGERIGRLIEVVQRVAEARNLMRVGLVEEVLVEGPSRTDSSLLRGRTRRNTTVNFVGTAAPGELVSVTVERATSTTLRGTQLAAVAA